MTFLVVLHICGSQPPHTFLLSIYFNYLSYYLFILTNIIDDRVWFMLKKKKKQNKTNSFLDFDPLKFMCTT